MKKFLAVLFSLITINAYSQNIGIGTNNPDSSAALHISDTSKGILIPRMTMNQRLNIFNPADGLMVYQTDSTKGFWYYDGTEWKNVAATINVANTGSDLKTLIYTVTGF